MTGITDNTGSSFTAGTVYSQPWIDPNNASPTFGVQDSVAANGGGAQVLSSQLQLAVGAGTSDLFVNHNFVDSPILSSGGFSVSLNVLGESQTGYQQGGAFAIGMSQAKAATAGDAFNSAPSMTGAFNDADTLGANVYGTVLSDFWVALRGNGSLAWGSSSGVINGVSGLSKAGVISANFMFSSFAAGSTVNYEILYNGTSEGAGSFTWSGTDENYIGIDGRDSSAVTFDNFSVSTIAPVPEPTTLALFALGGVGLLIRRRKA